MPEWKYLCAGSGGSRTKLLDQGHTLFSRNHSPKRDKGLQAKITFPLAAANSSLIPSLSSLYKLAAHPVLSSISNLRW